MNNREPDAVWTKKGCTLSDKSAREEFGLTHDEIIKAVGCGELHYRVNSVYGNPFLRLIRSEVEALVEKKYGGTHLEKRRIQAELVQIDRDLRALRKKAIPMEKRRAELLASLERMEKSTKSAAARRTRCGLLAGKRGR